MREKDAATKAYMELNDVFADVMNYYIYDGEEVLRPEDLEPYSETELALLRKEDGRGLNAQAEQDYRDVMKSAVIRTDGRIDYVLLAVENQSEIHYAMPVRNLLYDALQYGGQVRSTAGRHRKEDNDGRQTQAEFLSGFRRNDHLKPVFTIVVYYGTQRWDGPKSLHEMMEPLPPGIEELVQDYRIHLIEPSTMTEEDFDKFHTDLGEVMRFLQAADDKEKLSALFHSRPIYRKIRLEAALVLNTCGKLRMKMEPDEEGDVDMCKGWEGMLQDAVEEGIEKRVQEVVEERVQEVVEERVQEVVEERVQEVVKERVQEAVKGAREDERKKSAICSVRELIRNTGWTIEQAMNAIAVAEEYRGAVREALG